MAKTLEACLFGISIAFAVTSARADVPVATIEPPHELRTEPFDARPLPDDHGGTWLRAAGISFVTFGGAHMALGLYGRLFDSWSDRRNCFGACGMTTGQKWAVAASVAGGLLTAIGIPLWIVGSRRMDRAERALHPEEARAPMLLVGPRAASLRFRF